MIPFAFVGLDTISAANVVTDTLELTDTAEYALVSYAPTIAPRRANRLAGQSRLAEVADSITLDVLGSTVQSCVAAYERLVGRLQQAARWWAGEGVEAVRVRMRVQSPIKSTVGDLVALIYGPPDDTPAAQANPLFEADIQRWAIRGVTLTFIRRGLLTGLTPATATSAATPVKTIGTCTFSASADQPTPTKLTITPNNSITVTPGYVLIAAQNGIILENADSYTNNYGSIAKVTDAAANRSVATQVVRVTAPNGGISIPIGTILWTHMAVFAMVRVNTVGGEWRLTTGAQVGATNTQEQAVDVAYDQGFPQPVLLGVFTSPAGFYTFINLDATGNTGTIDIDSLYLVRIDLPAAIFSANILSAGLSRSASFVIQIDPRDTTERQPTVQLITPAGAYTDTFDYNGEIFVTSEGTGLSFVMLDGTTSAAWRAGSGSTVYTDTVVAARAPVYLTPQ